MSSARIVRFNRDLHQVTTQSSLHDFLLLQKQFKNSKPRSLDNDILVEPVVTSNVNE